MEARNQQQRIALGNQAGPPQPAGLALNASAGAAAAPPLPAISASFRKHPRKQRIVGTREIQERILAARKLAEEAEALEVLKIAKQAADSRHKRQQATVERMAAKKQKEEQLEATRAAAKAEAASKRTCTKKGKKQGHASLAGRPGDPEAASQRQSKPTSGNNSSSCQQGPSTPLKKVARAQPSSSSDSQHGAASMEVDVTKYCDCCYDTSTSQWRRGHLQPYIGARLCNICRICELRHGSLEHSDKVGKYLAAFLTQQAQQAQQAQGFEAAAEGMMEVEQEVAHEQGPQTANEQEGSAVHNSGAGGSHTTGLPQPAVAAATAAQEDGQVQRYSLRNLGRRQLMQQAQLDGDDEGSGTETGPKAARKRPMEGSLMQRPAKKRAEMGGGARFHAALLAADGTGMMEGEGSGADIAGPSDGTLAAMEDGVKNVQQRRVLTRKMLTRKML